MLSAALRYPLATPAGRDAFAVCTGLVVGSLLLARVAVELWPAWVALLPAVLTIGPVVLFAGYLGAVLGDDVERSDPPSFRWSLATVRAGVRALLVGAAYLLPPIAVIIGTVYVLLETGASPGASPLVAIAPTVALFVLIGFTYVLPAAVAAGLNAGIGAGLSRDAIGGLGNGAYFFAWTVAIAVLVVAWSVVGAVGIRSPLAVLGAIAGVYGTLVATRLVAAGLGRSRWEPPGDAGRD